MFSNVWSPENEAGIVNLGVAENSLMVRLRPPLFYIPLSTTYIRS
jgi:hypothetical protein